MEQSCKVLLVEDDEFSAMVTMQVLKGYCGIDLVETGEDALECAKKKKYDVVLMDIGLPGMGGLKAAGILRLMPGYENTPIVALTAFAMSGDREEFLKGGCSHYLSKPFAVSDLLNLVKSLVTETC
ncbi:MAG: response regulator [Bacteroidetes bacterium]|nr:response regulator [Bacteroidota bacterium]